MKHRFKVLVFLVSLAGFCSQGDAATTGKIMGRIADQTGAPLPGVNVVVEGTNRGATSDEGGYYLILSMDPGSYTLRATMVGYTTSAKTDVRVSSDLTTTVDFHLSEATLELGEMTVVAERPPVEPDRTESRYVVSAEDIQVLPIVRTMESFVELEAGVNVDGSGRVRNAYFRGGSGEVAEYVVDGVRLTHQDGRNWTGEVNTSVVSEITVLAGGLNAEYGNIGSIQVVTQDGGRDYHGQTHYRFSPADQQHWGSNVYESPVHQGRLKYDDPEWVDETDAAGRRVHQRPEKDYTDVTGHFLEASLSGPIAQDVSFIVSSKHDLAARDLPRPERRTPFNADVSYKLTASVTPDLKLRAGGLYSRNKGRYADGFNARGIFLPEGQGAGGRWVESDHMIYASATHVLSPRTFYEVRLSHFTSTQDTMDIPTQTVDPTLDRDGWFYATPGTVRQFQTGQQKRLTVRMDLSSQATRGHFLKTGFSLTRFDAHYLDSREDTQTRNRRLFFYGNNGRTGEGITPWELMAYVQDKMEFQGLVVNAGLRYERFWGAQVPLHPHQAAPMTMSYTRYASYARYGTMRPLQWFLPRIGISHPITSRSKIHFFYGKYHTRPELELFFRNRWQGTGAASLDHNNDGRIGPQEENNNLFQNDGFGATFATDLTTYQNVQVSTAFELGSEWNFIGDFTLQSTAYYRVSSGFLQVQGMNFWDPALGTKSQSRVLGPTSHATTRGMELSLKKGLRHNFSFKAAINLGWGEHLDTGGTKAGRGGTTVYPDASFVSDPSRYWNEWSIDPATGEEIPKPPTGAKLEGLKQKAQQQVDLLLAGDLGSASEIQRIFKLWEQPGLSQEDRDYLRGLYALQSLGWRAGSRDDARRTNGSMVLIYASPPDFGPGGSFLGSKLFGDVRANVVYRIYTGLVFIFTDPQTNIKAKREGPTNATVDFSLQKGFNIQNVRPLFYVEVNNLFNHRLMRTQSEQTPVDYLRWGLLGPWPDNTLYRQFGDTDELDRFENEPRQIFAGFRITW